MPCPHSVSTLFTLKEAPTSYSSASTLFGRGYYSYCVVHGNKIASRPRGPHAVSGGMLEQIQLGIQLHCRMAEHQALTGLVRRVSASVSLAMNSDQEFTSHYIKWYQQKWCSNEPLCPYSSLKLYPKQKGSPKWPNQTHLAGRFVP